MTGEKRSDRLRRFKKWVALPLLAAEDVLVGGQAVMEGVLMRIPTAYGIAVRDADGQLHFRQAPIKPKKKGSPTTWPLIRGAWALFGSLALGLKALNFSAEVALEEEERIAAEKKKAKAEAKKAKAEAKAKAKKAGKITSMLGLPLGLGAVTLPEGGDEPEAPAEGAASPEEPKKSTSNDLMLYGTLAVSLIMGVGLFFYLPLVLTKFAANHFPVFQDRLWFNLLDGAIRLVFFLAYVVIISMMEDIKRVFMYHGAEHKVVFAWEKKLPLTPAGAKPMSTLHPRCGTSFLLFVMVVSIFVFSLIKLDMPHWQLFLYRLPLLPVIAGISYELIRISAKHQNSMLAKLFMSPGLLLQKLTTREPDEQMLEVAIAALDKALAVEKGEIEAQAL